MQRPQSRVSRDRRELGPPGYPTRLPHLFGKIASWRCMVDAIICTISRAVYIVRGISVASVLGGYQSSAQGTIDGRGLLLPRCKPLAELGHAIPDGLDQPGSSQTLH